MSIDTSRSNEAGRKGQRRDPTVFACNSCGETRPDEFYYYLRRRAGDVTSPRCCVREILNATALRSDATANAYRSEAASSGESPSTPW
jgi:hypothetical protein